MSDELNKNEVVAPEEQQQAEAVVQPTEQETPQVEATTEIPAKEEVAEKPAEEEKEVVEKPEGEQEEPSPEEPDKAAEEPPAEEPPVEEEQKEKVEEEDDDDLPTVEDFERVQAELEEIKIAEADRQVMQQLRDKDAAREQQLRAIEGQLADRLELELNRYGIDLNKSLAELQKEDAAKFQIAQGLINQSRAQAEQARAFVEEQKAADAREAIFNKAGMLMAKYDLAEDEANSVAETFLDIIDAAGVRDLGEDLKNKVELAVAKVRFVGGKLKKAVKETKEAVESSRTAIEAIKETADAVVETVKPEPPTKEELPEKAAELPKVEEQEQPQQPEITEDIKKEALAEAMGDAVPEANKNVPTEGDGATVENVLEKLMATPFKERVEFYKKHEALINEARKIQLRNESMNNGFFN